MRPFEAVQGTIPKGMRASVHSGDRVQVHILRAIGTNKWLATVRGRSLQVASAEHLDVGARYRARAEWSGPRLILRLIGESARSRTISGDSSGRYGATLAAALRRGGVELKPELERRLRTLLAETAKSDLKNARLLGIMADKGLLPSAESLDVLRRVLDGEVREYDDTADEGGGSRNDNNPERRGGGDPRRQPPENEHGRRSLCAKRVERDKLGEAVADILSEFGEPGQGGGALAAFNHSRGAQDDWIVVPFDIAIDTVELSGSIRVQIGPRNDRIHPANVTVHTSDNEWEVGLYPESGGYRITLHCSNTEVLSRAKQGLAALREKLRNMGVHVDDNCIEGSPDGFGPCGGDPGTIDITV